MLQRRSCILKNLRIKSIISILLVFHFSILIFLSNVDFKEFSTTRSLSTHYAKLVNISFISIIRTRKKNNKNNHIQKIKYNLPYKNLTTYTNRKLNSEPEYSFTSQSLHKDRYKFLRPPPVYNS